MEFLEGERSRPVLPSDKNGRDGAEREQRDGVLQQVARAASDRVEPLRGSADRT
jgi:hypothetical protein